MNGRLPGAVTLEVLVHGADGKEVEWIFRNIRVGSATGATLSLAADGSIGQLDVDFDGDGWTDIVSSPIVKAD